MADELERLTAKPHTSNYGTTYRVAYDGRVFGDDRGYHTEAACLEEIDRRIAKDAADAIRFDRPVRFCKG